MTRQQVIAELQISEGTLDNLRHRGCLKAYRLGAVGGTNRSIRFRRADVEALLIPT